MTTGPNICMPCEKDNHDNCLYEVVDFGTHTVTICRCDDADHIACTSCRRPLLDMACEHQGICADCIVDFIGTCEDCAREDRE